jgi:hypothetical protein
MGALVAAGIALAALAPALAAVGVTALLLVSRV